jgi:predicted acylesterase/phospholipase RssA
MSSAPAKAQIVLSDLKRFSFYRFLFKSIWLFFPGIIFLILAYLCFWKLTQGRDLMVITLENRDVFAYFILAQLFWVYCTWYSSRLVGKAKEFEQPCDDNVWTTFRVQGPRLLAYTCFTIVILAFFQLPPFKNNIVILSRTICNIVFWGSIPFYFVNYRLWEKFSDRRKKSTGNIRFLKKLQLITWLVLLAGAIVVILFKTLAGLIILLLVMQQALLILLILRRKIIEAKGASFYQQEDTQRGFTKQSVVGKKTTGLLFDGEDKDYFRFFFRISVVVLAVYLFTVFSVSFASNIGSFPFVLMAFGVLLLLGNIVSFFSVLKHFNFHMVLIVLAFIIGNIFEPHYVKLPEKKDKAVLFSERQNLVTYFRNWVNDPERKKILDNDSVTSYPVFFGLANGGASRSGYWVASVLAKLEDTTRGEFSKHLFCLSGASGGSVGNAAFFSLLRGRDQLRAKDPSDTAMYHAATDYLRSDFLTFTLARMLGPDVFRHIIPLRSIDDRAEALANALERSCGEKTFLYDSLSVGFSQLITQKSNPDYRLPILCINTTRMQDGSPAVISTVSLSERSFNNRVDVLTLLDEEKDLKLSSAVVMGASFPYLSPAGRINGKVTVIREDKSEKEYLEPQYFVDGGYFDNSGAGVVNEMMTVLRAELENDTSLRKYAAKLQFYVLHISNDPIGYGRLTKVNPLINDLAAPLKTLMGGYGSQTAVNDMRLYNYMKSWYKNEEHYITVNLYRHFEKVHYSMNWVISGYLLEAMKQRLGEHENMGRVISLIE